MNKIRSYRIINCFLAALMLFTSLGLNVDMHFCQGTLKSISLFGKAPSCHQLATKPSCHSAEKSSCTANMTLDNVKKSCKKGCCNNKSQLIKYEGDLIVSQTIVPTFHAFQFIIISIAEYLFNNISYVSENNKYHNYKPPLLNIDIPVFIQSFLL